MGRGPTGCFTVAEHFPDSTISRLEKISALQKELQKIDEENFDTINDFILNSIFIKKENISILVDTIVTFSYCFPEKIQIYAKLVQNLITKADPNQNYLSTLDHKVIKFIFKSIIPHAYDVQFPKLKSVAFLYFLRNLYTLGVYDIDTIYKSAKRIKIYYTFYKFFFPEFTSLDQIELSSVKENTINPLYINNMISYYKKKSNVWDQLLTKHVEENTIESIIISDDITAFEEFIQNNSFDPNGFAEHLMMHPVASEFQQINYLSFACLFHAEKIFDKLIELGAKPETNNFTTVHCAIRGRSTKILSYLTDNDIPLKLPNNDNAAKFAVRYFNQPANDFIFERKILSHQVKTAANVCMEYCGESGNFIALTDLIDKRVYISYNSGKRDILVAACENGHKELVSILLLSPSLIIDVQDSLKRTPLYAASECGFSKIVQDLVQHNANGSKLALNKRTPFYAAAQNGNLKCLQYLSQCSTIDINAYEFKGQGMTAFQVAIDNGFLDCVKFISSLPNADIHKHGSNGTPSLILAMNAFNQAASADIFKFIISSNPDFEWKERYKRMTPYMYSIANNKFDITDIITSIKPVKIGNADQQIVANHVTDILNNPLEPIDKFCSILKNLIKRKNSISKHILGHSLLYAKRNPEDNLEELTSKLGENFNIEPTPTETGYSIVIKKLS
ncbi:hypothetical protein TVAG_464490 [Trichomonas vaginalis G3]|uniref:Uncharacterized protein n=1 Tax=Trichomonas vaginalis (strain ATCC PRA-98 / G3) TaxID=412133 RepID=A2EEJ4_TRIV3|nr:ankyrin repeat-containing family [Trichomonas vaginalis G3]EAY08901.1 hypothetical protein TVAG_464490 [Trichomonas vaginalis G3]KAI5494377.1 ankyrin repeat-containing family [Trichomonas vaginalis G3]|eukprot:XP_001321124.1 hypothetical protein [Trichomonas vaginalis G3]